MAHSAIPIIAFHGVESVCVTCTLCVVYIVKEVASFRVEVGSVNYSLIYRQKPSIIVKRFKFNSRNRQTRETIAVNVAALSQLTEVCNFGASLDDMLRD